MLAHVFCGFAKGSLGACPSICCELERRTECSPETPHFRNVRHYLTLIDAALHLLPPAAGSEGHGDRGYQSQCYLRRLSHPGQFNPRYRGRKPGTLDFLKLPASNSGRDKGVHRYPVHSAFTRLKLSVEPAAHRRFCRQPAKTMLASVARDAWAGRNRASRGL